LTGQNALLSVVQFDDFFNNAAERNKNFGLVITGTAAIYQAGRAADITLVFFRPPRYFGVTGAFFHLRRF